LSNELFYEIFEYLDGCDIYKAFANLNSRFEHLITCSSIPFKIKLYSEARSELEHCCKTVIIPNTHRVLSFDFENKLLIDTFFTHCIIDSSFNRLQSIVLRSIEIVRAVVLLFYLKSVPRLFSLTMYIDAEWNYNLNDIYRMVFSFPSLKYNKISLFSYSEGEDVNISVPLAINEKFSNIEYLVINHCCTFNELLSMLHHTPRLCRLTCDSLVESDTYINAGQPLTLSNLTYICINYPLARFYDFEMFMMQLSAPVQVLSVSLSYDQTYLDGDHWKRLIIKHMPHLRRFDFKYRGHFQISLDETSFDAIIHRFTSPFWIERQCFFEFAMNIDDEYINWSIRPYRYIPLSLFYR
jgi:hypothetical protein